MRGVRPRDGTVMQFKVKKTNVYRMAQGESGVDQLVEIIKVLGTPTREARTVPAPNFSSGT